MLKLDTDKIILGVQLDSYTTYDRPQHQEFHTLL